jgi:hypothetical protein
MSEDLWPRAGGGENETYGATFDYGDWQVEVVSRETGEAETHDVSLGELGAMFRGVVGGVNMARPPWGWFDRNEEDRRQGEWFLTPAETIKRHFDLDDRFSTVYRHHPVMGVYRD